MCQQFAPAVRIVNAIDESQLTTLKGNTHPAANAMNDRGKVSDSLPMTNLILVLSRSAEQQAAFDKFVASQYDPYSPNFHQWLEPEQVGAYFGPSETDIATISNWLTGHGFTVDEVGKDRMSIRFSGTAGQVQSAFHTQIHDLVVNGVPHIANMSDPQIPTALLPAVVGVKSLHNFFARPLHKLGSLVTRDGQTGAWKRGTNEDATTVQMKGSRATGSIRPQFGINDPTYGLEEDVTPYDFATIYNVAPLWSGTTSAGVIDGTGQTIAIAGTSSINPPDITAFRNAFGPLPTNLPANTPQLVSGNSSPVTVCTDTTGKLPYPSNPCELDDLLENSLDVEWSGAVAKNAQIVLVSSYPTSATDDGLFDSESYIINNLYKTVKIMSVSYGACELVMGTAGNAEYNTLWQTAYTEGIAVFVASGDQGSANCDAGLDTSTPYPAEYGLSVSGFASTPYNTAVGGTDLNWGSTASPYWGASNNSNGSNALGYIPEVPWNDTCTNPILVAALNSDIGASLTATQMCDDIYTEYVYSNSRSGELALLSLIDIVGGSGGMSSCTTGDGSHVSSCTGGYSKPSWQAGVTGIPNDGARDIPDVSFFASNGFLGSAYLICVSEAGSACTYSATSENVAQEIGGTSVSSPAMAGVMALINEKAGTPQGNPNTELYALAAKQTYGSCSAERGGGSPVISSSCYFNDIDTGTIAMPCDYSDKSPNCVGTDEVGILSGYGAAAGYDLATGLGSLNVANVVNAWQSSNGTGTATVTVTPAQSSITVNLSLSVPVTVTGSGTAPTGTVTLSGGGYTSAAGTLSGGAYTFTIPADSLSAGTDTLTVTYSGDANYATASGTANVAVSKLAASVSVNPSATTLNSNTSLTVSGAVTGSGGTPTGTVTLSGGGYTSAAQTLSGGSYSFTVPANSLTAGSDTLVVAYSGDTSYGVANGSTTVTVTSVIVLTPTVTVSATPNPVNSNASLSVTAKVTGSGVTPTGTVTLTSGSYSSGPQALSGGSYTFTFAASSLSSGSDTLTVNYSGDSSYAAGIGTGNVTVNASTFTLTASAAAAISSPGGSSSSTITLFGFNGYSGTATLSCALTGYSAGAAYLPSCTVPSTAVSAGGTAVATVSTTAATSELVYPKTGGKGSGWAGAGGGAVLAFLVFMGIPARRRSWRSMLGMLVLMVALGGLAGCGGGSTTTSGGGGTSGTTVGTYTFTVTGVGTPAVSPTPTTTFTVTVN
jgi:subtilase family serine protease